MKGQQCFGLCQEELCQAQQPKGGEPSALFGPGETTSEVLCTVHGSPQQEGHGYSGENPRLQSLRQCSWNCVGLGDLVCTQTLDERVLKGWVYTLLNGPQGKRKQVQTETGNSI